MAVENIPTPVPSMFVGKGVAPSTAKVRLVHIASGNVHEAWPIDAREHVKAGDFVYEADYNPSLFDGLVAAATTELVVEDPKTTTELVVDEGSKTTTKPKKGQ
jgi:hypothetical protein